MNARHVRPNAAAWPSVTNCPAILCIPRHPGESNTSTAFDRTATAAGGLRPSGSIPKLLGSMRSPWPPIAWPSRVGEVLRPVPDTMVSHKATPDGSTPASTYIIERMCDSIRLYLRNGRWTEPTPRFRYRAQSISISISRQRPPRLLRHRGYHVSEGQQSQRARAGIDDYGALDHSEDVAGLGQHQRGHLSGGKGRRSSSRGPGPHTGVFTPHRSLRGGQILFAQTSTRTGGVIRRTGRRSTSSHPLTSDCHSDCDPASQPRIRTYVLVCSNSCR